MPTVLDKVLYTAHAHTTGGREGRSVSSDGVLDVRLTAPKELGGKGDATNPEQLFAVGYAGCYLGAMRFVAGNEKLGTVPPDASVTAKVGIGPRAEGGFGLQVELKVSMPGVDRATAEKIAERGHFICPYSNATKGNIDVTTIVV